VAELLPFLLFYSCNRDANAKRAVHKTVVLIHPNDWVSVYLQKSLPLPGIRHKREALNMNKQNHGEPSRNNIAQKHPISNSSNSNADASSPNKTKYK
jgi:hypothetical protein